MNNFFWVHTKNYTHTHTRDNNGWIVGSTQQNVVGFFLNSWTRENYIHRRFKKKLFTYPFIILYTNEREIKSTFYVHNLHTLLPPWDFFKNNSYKD